MAEDIGNPMRRPIHVALLTSGEVNPAAGGAFTADEALLLQIIAALRPEDTSTVVRLVDSGKTPNSRAQESETQIFRRSPISRAMGIALRHPACWRLQRRGHLLLKSSLEGHLISEGVDLVVGCAPGLASLDWQRLPYWAAFWDLGHRDLSEFPEVTQSRLFEMRERTNRRGLTRASMIVTESEESIRNLAHTYGLLEDRMLAIRLVPDVVADYDEPQPGRDPNLAIYPAQFWPHKNHLVLLHAIDLLVRQGRNPRRLVLTGSDKGNEAHVRRRARDLGIGDHVVFSGFVTAAALRDLYSRASIMVMPSLLGPTNLPPLEALSHGCAVAACHALDARLVSPTGVLEVLPFDVPAWADLLDRDIPVALPDRAQVRKGIEARMKSNHRALRGALDQFALRRALWP